ncbi:MAG: hypothetical protein GF353_20310 [Candidatus Lokiarchaeota archaeon]|nr:hypothetical protein [Candidatus Lokiarchaeota archaeon]
MPSHKPVIIAALIAAFATISVAIINKISCDNKKSLPEFHFVKGVTYHPDSTIILQPMNDGAEKKKAILFEIDGFTFTKAGDYYIEDDMIYWDIDLKKLGLPDTVRCNGIHSVRLGFSRNFLSEIYPVEFDCTSPQALIGFESDSTGEKRIFGQVMDPNKKIKQDISVEISLKYQENLETIPLRVESYEDEFGQQFFEFEYQIQNIPKIAKNHADYESDFFKLKIEDQAGNEFVQESSYSSFIAPGVQKFGNRNARVILNKVDLREIPQPDLNDLLDEKTKADNAEFASGPSIILQILVQTEHYVKLSWNRLPAEIRKPGEAYLIRRNNENYGTSFDTTFTDTQIDEDSLYLYQVLAKNKENKFHKSNVVSADIAEGKFKIAEDKKILEDLKEESDNSSNKLLSFSMERFILLISALTIFIVLIIIISFSENRISKIVKFLVKRKFELSALIIISLVVLTFGGDLYNAVLLIDAPFRALIYGIIFCVVLISILTFIPVKITTAFYIVSKYISFLYSPGKNINEFFFKSAIDVKDLNFINIDKFDLSAMKLFELSNEKPLIFDDHVIIKPWDETTDLNIKIKKNESDSLLRIHNLSFRYTKLEIGLSYVKNSLSIFLKNPTKNKGYNTIELNSSLQLIFNKCRIFDNDGHLLTVIDSTKSFNYVSTNRNKALLKFSTGHGSSKIEMKSPNVVDEGTNTLIEGLFLKKLHFWDINELANEKKISSVQSGTIKTVLRKMDPHDLKPMECIVFSPNIIKSFQLKLNSEGGIKSIFKAKLRTLKYGELITIDDSLNEIPKFTEWLIEHNKPLAFAILFTGWIIVLLLQPYLESLFSELFF